jgi:hypothetical protein
MKVFPIIMRVIGSRLPGAGYVTRVPSSDHFRLVDWEAECLSDSFTINWVGLREVFKLSFDDELRHTLHRRRDVAEQPLLFICRQQPVKIASLRVIIVAEPVIVPICLAGDAQGRFFETYILDRATEAVRFVVDKPAAIAVKAHRAIAVVRVRHGRMWTIDRQALSIHAEPITMRVGVRQEARLQHLVRAERNARHNVGGRKSGLLNFGVIIFRVAVEFEVAPP